jgi:hypothetical protein
MRRGKNSKCVSVCDSDEIAGRDGAGPAPLMAGVTRARETGAQCSPRARKFAGPAITVLPRVTLVPVT